MKTTIKINGGAIVVEPSRHSGNIVGGIQTGGAEVQFFALTPDQAGALIFGIESALQTLELQRARMAESVEG